MSCSHRYPGFEPEEQPVGEGEDEGPPPPVGEEDEDEEDETPPTDPDELAEWEIKKKVAKEYAGKQAKIKEWHVKYDDVAMRDMKQKLSEGYDGSINAALYDTVHEILTCGKADTFSDEDEALLSKFGEIILFLTTEDQYIHVTIVKHGGISALHVLLRSKDLKTIELALRSLLAIALGAYQNDALVEESLLRDLGTFVEDHIADVEYRFVNIMTMELVAAIAARDKEVILVQCGTGISLIRAINKEGAHNKVIRACLPNIQKLVLSNPYAAKLLVQQGMFPLLLELLDYDDGWVYDRIVEILNVLMGSEITLHQLPALGCSRDVLNLVTKPSVTPELRKVAASAFVAMSLSTVCQNMMIEEEKVGMPMQWLDLPDPQFKADCLATYANLAANHTIHKQLLQMGILEMAVEGLAGDDRSIDMVCLRIFTNMGKDPFYQMDLCQVPGLLDALFAKTTSEDPVQAEQAVRLICVLFESPASRKEVAEAGCFNPMVDVLRNGPELFMRLTLAALHRGICVPVEDMVPHTASKMEKLLTEAQGLEPLDLLAVEHNSAEVRKMAKELIQMISNTGLCDFDEEEWDAQEWERSEIRMVEKGLVLKEPSLMQKLTQPVTKAVGFMVRLGQ